ncbi:hypothetical protein CEXT_520361 [Caerostris extrusa]|uniref:Uncharacterized protein n=1 Tax=Caerostris extrusa TaxID=172846 RepID=A0AAV4PMH0_CAEEX|nr:hypothetical protein CEXT_520361 [Caerostris extrusa]
MGMSLEPLGHDNKFWSCSLPCLNGSGMVQDKRHHVNRIETCLSFFGSSLVLSSFFLLLPFLEDFIGSGGVECLLEVLRVCQARQNDAKAPKGRQQQTMLRKISSNQYDCLLCLKYAVQNPKSVIRVTEDAHGLSSICSCFMSTYPKSRILTAGKHAA